ncbi:helix-turn-helix domain-containing protein [Edaphocola aurantiacus]|uniref:helix-turn-helix domain-containing protein n=1 Tax=Edaphocola aurantiacus TaxID=2601682 RepID=UPI001C969CDD|nr:helix-turn-helix domain-containing protein [Edaphocola aurantiacus]
MQYVIVIGIFQALLAIILLWQNKLRSNADNLLIMLMVCIAAHLSIKFVIFNFVQDQQVRQQMNTFIAYCYGPLLYLYALKRNNPSLIPASKWYVFIPVLIGFVGYTSITGVLIYAPADGYRLLHWYNEISFWTLVGSDLFFALSTLHLIRQDEHNKIKEKQLITRLAYCFLVISGLAFGFYIAGKYMGTQYVILSRSVVYSMLVYMCVLIIRHKYMTVQEVSPEKEQVLPQQAPAEMTLVAFEMQEPAADHILAVQRKHGLQEQAQQKIWADLERYLQQHKLFTDMDLSLDKLAAAMDISKYHLSETLNNHGNTTFYRYINEQRVHYAQEQIAYLHGQGISINMLSVALDSGFKAKSSFNRYFKELLGLTPTEYIRSLEQIAPPDGMLAVH